MLNNTIIKSINPFIKILSFLIYILFIFLKFDNVLFTYTLSLVFIIILLSSLTLKDIIKVIWKLRYILIIYIFILCIIKLDYIFVFTFLLKGIFGLIYFYIIILTCTRYELSNAIVKIINLFNIINLNLNKLRDKIYFNIRYICNYYSIIKSNYSLYSYRGIDYGYLNIIQKVKFNLKERKKVKEYCINDIENMKKDMIYRSYNSKNRYYKYERCLKTMDYIYLFLHLVIIFIYVWRIRI